jgi:diacylglycerol kinase family enzyme
VPIAKGQPWGERRPLPPGGVVVDSDDAARRVIEEARSRGQAIPGLGLIGGDLWRTLGGSDSASAERLRSSDAMTFPVDLGTVEVDGRSSFFVAHVVAYSRLWRRTFIALNAQWRGAWDLGPRSHPNDGLLDTFDASLTFDDLWKVRARLPTGSHLPHPRIKERRAPQVTIAFARSVIIEVDGVVAGRARSLAVGLEPDALTVVI